MKTSQQRRRSAKRRHMEAVVFTHFCPRITEISSADDSAGALALKSVYKEAVFSFALCAEANL